MSAPPCQNEVEPLENASGRMSAPPSSRLQFQSKPSFSASTNTAIQNEAIHHETAFQNATIRADTTIQNAEDAFQGGNFRGRHSQREHSSKDSPPNQDNKAMFRPTGKPVKPSPVRPSPLSRRERRSQKSRNVMVSPLSSILSSLLDQTTLQFLLLFDTVFTMNFLFKLCYTL